MTGDGRALVARLLGAHLAGGAMVVGDGDQTARAPLSISGDGATVVASAVFGELEANFAWRSRAIVDADGLVVDELEQDMGEKRLGAVWTIDVPIEVPEVA